MTPLACREVNKGDELQLSIKQQVPNECWRQNCYLHLIFLLVFNAVRATATRLPIHQFNGRICNTPENCLYIIYQKPLFCNRLFQHLAWFFCRFYRRWGYLTDLRRLRICAYEQRLIRRCFTLKNQRMQISANVRKIKGLNDFCHRRFSFVTVTTMYCFFFSIVTRVSFFVGIIFLYNV